MAFALCALLPTLSWADARDFDFNLEGYVARMFIALFILGAAGFAAVKIVPEKFRPSARGGLKLMGVLNLGREAVYLVRIGPDVVAFCAGKAGSFLLGRWSAEEWNEYEAALSEQVRGASSGREGS